jgi:hypothetical protein
VLILVVRGVLREVNHLEVLVAGTLATVYYALHLPLIFFAATVTFNELIDGKVSSTNANYDRLAFDLHEDPLTMVAVNPCALALKVHLGPHPEGFGIDEVREYVVNRAILDRLVDAEVGLKLLLQVGKKPV